MRRVDEIERVARRWSVDDDEVVVPFVVQLVELLGCHVLLRSGERAGDAAVEGVREDAVGLFGGACVAPDEAVERRLRVEHQRGQPA